MVRENQTVKLDDLKEICKKHAAFKEPTKLEEVAAKYPNIKIIFVPKFYCELNPIEGVWAFSKNRNRRYNDLSSFNNYIDLLNETKQIIKEHVLCKKLWRRFWNVVKAYKKGYDVIFVLTEYFSLKSQSKIQEHRRITNTNI